MSFKITMALAALALGAALASGPAFAKEEGPSAANFGAGSTPQAGGIIEQPTSPQTRTGSKRRPLYNAVKPIHRQ